MSDIKIFSENLRNICAEYGPVAQVCREIGINRQQFNRYLSGAGLPSAHNLRKISRHFQLSDTDLFTDPSEFQRSLMQGRKQIPDGPAEMITGAFRDQSHSLRKYLGFYHSHFTTPTWEGKILRSLVWLYEVDGFVMSRSIERVRSSKEGLFQNSRYAGLVTQRGNRLYIVEQEMVREGSIVETILTPSHRQQVKYLRGTTMGVAWRPHIMPYASLSIWKRISDRVTIREALKDCGVFSLDSRHIDPTIKRDLRQSPSGSAVLY